VTPGWPFRRGPGAGRGVPWMDPADADPDGLVGVGGTLTPGLLLRAYADGVFPWFNDDDPVLWWSPDPRAVIELDELHVSRRLDRTIRSGKFRTTANTAFEAVMRGCGENRPDGTWVTEEMIRGYTALHAAGHAHSIEVWGVRETPRPPHSHAPVSDTRAGWDRDGERILLDGRELVGGIYGVAIGGLFAGESMFHRVADASKVALVTLVERLKARGYELFDVQMTTEHTERMGAKNIPRADYLRRLRDAVRRTDVRF
jgi:leucyl/phenylalanyl-tRNA--protein transferase